MARMKIILLSSPFVFASLALAQALGNFEPVLIGLAQLPLVGGMAWILMRQQDKHQETIKTLVTHFSDRSQKKDEFYQRLLSDTLKTIEELAKK